MTAQKTPRVIFVDGFNTVGKDHFIKELDRLLPDKVIHSDPRVWFPVFQKSQRYWDFIYRCQEENNAIFNAHLMQMKKMDERLEDGFTSDMVIVSNRSFVSALNYNFIPEQFRGRKIGGDEITRSYYFNSYAGLIQKVFQVPTLMVNLDHFHGDKAQLPLIGCVQEVRSRMHQRDPNLLMNDFYLEYLIDAYKNPSQEVKNLYTYWENVSSSDAGFIVDKYLQNL